MDRRTALAAAAAVAIVTVTGFAAITANLSRPADPAPEPASQLTPVSADLAPAPGLTTVVVEPAATTPLTLLAAAGSPAAPEQVAPQPEDYAKEGNETAAYGYEDGDEGEAGEHEDGDEGEAGEHEDGDEGEAGEHEDGDDD